MRVLIIGGSSLLGKYLTATKPDKVNLSLTWFTNYTGLPMLQLDVSNKSQIAYVFEKVKPQVVIHCAAVGSVDYTEAHFTETHHVNVTGMKNVLKATRDIGGSFIYISTNAVFDGNNPPYSEISPCQPINRYGRIKHEAELAVQSERDWLIIRPFLLYGWPYLGGRTNWFATIIKNLMSGEVTKLVDDRYWQHTFAEDVALTIWRLIELGVKEEVYNVAADESMSLFEFGKAISEIWGYDTNLIQSIASSELKIAPRPINTTFDLTKIHNLGIQLRGVEEGLKTLK